MEKNPNLSPSSSPSSSSNSSNGVGATLPPLTPKSTPPQPCPCPYPTTFVQADTQSFKQMVQLLTGSAETAAKRSNPNPNPTKNPIPPLSRSNKPSFKLYERRPSMKNLKMIGPLIPTVGSTAAAASSALRSPLSPSVLDFPSLTLSPVTPLIPDPFDRSPQDPNPNPTAEEERAIKEKGFYLHPSPRAVTPSRAEPPQLLPLFPVTSPRDSN